MTTVAATPMISPIATIPPRIPTTPPGGPCGIGFSADRRRHNSVRLGAVVIDGAGWDMSENKQTKKKTLLWDNSGFKYLISDNTTQF